MRPDINGKEHWVCVAFARGACVFGNRCVFRHPNEKNMNEYMAKVATIMCRYGKSCAHTNCPYNH